MSNEKICWLLTVIKNFSTILCIMPNVCFDTGRVTYQKSKKLYSLVISVFMVTMRVHTILIQMKDQRLSPMGVAINFLCEVSGLVLFVHTVLGSAYWRVSEWKYFLVEMNKLASANRKPLDKLDHLSLFILLVMCNACFIVIMVYYIYWVGIMEDEGNFNTVLVYLDFIADSFNYYFCEIFCMAICTLLIILRHSYTNLGQSLLKINSGNGLLVLKEVNYKYLALSELVMIFNKLLGFPLLFIYITTSSQFLSWLCYEMKVSTDLNSLFVFICGSMVLYGPVSVLFYCESVVIESENLVNICYRIELEESMKAMKNELTYTRCMMQKKQPLFTAENIIILKRSTMFSILSTMATYFIVVLQFK